MPAKISSSNEARNEIFTKVRSVEQLHHYWPQLRIGLDMSLPWSGSLPQITDSTYQVFYIRL